MNSQAPIIKPHSFWHGLFADEASFRTGQINFWAAAETILAISAFWIVAVHWETLWPLYSSLIVAPLLFLRSDASAKRGADWFDKGFFPPRWPHDPEEHKAAYRRLARRWLRIGRGVMLIALILSAILIFAVKRERLLELWLPISLGLAWAGIGVSIVGFGMRVGEREIAAAGGGVRGLLISDSDSKISALSGGILFSPPVALGIFVIALIARIFATAFHLSDGYRAMPANILRLALFIGPLHPPELLPGLSEAHDLRFARFMAAGRAGLSSPKWPQKIAAIFWLLVLPIWFAPGWFYRIILKSTLWLWWILLFVGGTPNIVGGAKGLAADYNKIWHQFSLVAAIFGLTLFLFANFFHPFILNQLSDRPLIPIVAVLFLIDWRSNPFLPLLFFLSSILTIGVWLWADSIIKDSDVPGRETYVARGLALLAHLFQWKTAIGVLTITLLVIYVAFLANARLDLWPLSDWLFNGLLWLYGENAAALRQSS